MSNELATVEESSIDLLPAARPASLEARRMLVAHAEMMQTAYELADGMCATQMVPARFRGKPQDGAAAILYGAELGLNPIQSLQRVVPIHGMPTLEARTMVALLKSRGYKVKTSAQSDESVTVVGVDLDGEEYESTWTMQRARKAGYVPEIDEKTGKYKTNANGNRLGNEKYLTDPQAMLKAKAQAEVCRDMAPEVLIGISYTSEELRSEWFDDRPPPQVKPTSAPITVEEILNEPVDTHSERQASTGEPIPEREQAIADSQATLDSDTATATPADTPEGPASTKQNRHMHALFRDLKITDRADRLTVSGAILGFKLDTSAALTSTEADGIISTLELWKSGRDEDGNEIDAQAIIREILNRASLAESETQTAATEQE